MNIHINILKKSFLLFSLLFLGISFFALPPNSLAYTEGEYTTSDIKVQGDPVNIAMWNKIMNTFIDITSNIFVDESTGNVGIGTTDPTVKLEVKDSIRAGGILINSEGAIDSANLRIRGNINDWNIDNYDGRLRFFTEDFGGGNGTERMRINTNGNVGIGTSSPDAKLHVKTESGKNAEIDIQSGNKSKWGIYHDESSESLTFWNVGNIFSLLKNGNAGIGTDTPRAKLDIKDGHINVSGNFGMSFGEWNSDISNPTPEAQLVLDGAHNNGYNLGTKLLIRGIDNETNTKAISVIDENSNELFNIQSLPVNFGTTYFKGNVGIGTTDPDAKLEVNGDAIFAGTVTSKPHYDWNTTISYTDGAWSTLAGSGASQQIETGHYFCGINFSSYNKGGRVYGNYLSFPFAWQNNTNGRTCQNIPFSGSAHAMNGKTVALRVCEQLGQKTPVFQLQVNGEAATNVVVNTKCTKFF